MSSRNYWIVVVIALAILATGLFLMLSNGDQQSQSVDTYPRPTETIEATEPEPPSLGTQIPLQGEVTAGDSDDAPASPVSRAPVAWPGSALAFAKQDDPDPTLSRYLEAELQSLIDATLDRAKYDAQPVICRRHRCQMLAVDRTSAPDPNKATLDRDTMAAGPPMTAFIAPILRDASSADIRNPTTGDSLKAQLELVQIARNEPFAVEFIIAFASP